LAETNEPLRVGSVSGLGSASLGLPSSALSRHA